MLEYGSRAGWWRIMEVFGQHGTSHSNSATLLPEDGDRLLAAARESWDVYQAL